MTILSKKKPNNSEKRADGEKDAVHSASRVVRLDSNSRNRNSPSTSATTTAITTPIPSATTCWSPSSRLDDSGSLNEISDSDDLSLTTLLNTNNATNSLGIVNGKGLCSPSANPTNKRKNRTHSPKTKRSVRSRQSTTKSVVCTGSTSNMVVDRSSSDESSISQNNSEDEYNVEDNKQFREYFKDADTLKEVNFVRLLQVFDKTTTTGFILLSRLRRRSVGR
jgi:hypothetical protein